MHPKLFLDPVHLKKSNFFNVLVTESYEEKTDEIVITNKNSPASTPEEEASVPGKGVQT